MGVASPDYVCRWGGDQFCVLLPETDEQGACTWAERCCSALVESKFYAESHKLSITASLGVAQRNDGMESPRPLLALAEQALSVAKQAGRQRVVTAWGGCLSQPSGVASCPTEPTTTTGTYPTLPVGSSAYVGFGHFVLPKVCSPYGGPVSNVGEGIADPSWRHTNARLF